MKNPRRKFTDSFGLGDLVAIIRTEHGWFDGRVSGTIEEISDFGCVVEVTEGDTISIGSMEVILKPRDIHLISKAGSKKKKK